MKKIGIFGGVFNPPHNFHFAVAEEILNNHPEFEKIIFMPVGDKYKKPEIIPAKHRYNMLKLACNKNKKIEVSDFEIQQEEQFYAYQTLDAFQKRYPDCQFSFIIGSDSLKTFETWKRYEYLLNRYEILVYPRGNDNAEKILAEHPILKNVKELFTLANCHISTNISSTFIRKSLKNGKKINYLLPEEVLKYIEEHKLYR
ncbi:MAG: nicotinate (nicotinamide) nucleotide adenylyltransferase [Clostridia bacterium]|nr:nicotinate (nicotinamide) nucleotide adenylyltransferase [Clostridia bacterium]